MTELQQYLEKEIDEMVTKKNSLVAKINGLHPRNIYPDAAVEKALNSHRYILENPDSYLKKLSNADKALDIFEQIVNLDIEIIGKQKELLETFKK